MTDFQSLLTKNVDDVKAPDLVPVGSYLMVLAKFTFGNAQNEEKTNIVTLRYNPIQPMEDVDQDNLAKAQESWGDRKLSDKYFEQDFFLTSDSLWRLTEHLKNVHRISGMNIQEGLQTAAQTQAVGMVVHDIAKKSKNAYAKVAQWAAAPTDD